MEKETSFKKCIREPIPEIAEAAIYLNDAVTNHFLGDHDKAAKLIKKSDMPTIREWTESIWGARSPYIKLRTIRDAPPILAKNDRVLVRMPSKLEKQTLHDRDGFHCRFCEIPVIRKEIRQVLKKLYPEVVQWGRKNMEQHAALQAMWLQYDHVLPHARGGNNDLSNVVITCAPCNFGRMDKLMEEIGVTDPRTRKPVDTDWDGLERLIQ